METIGLTVGPMTLAALTLLMATIGLTVGLATLAALTLTLERTVGLERLAALTLLMATIGLTVGLAVHTKLAMLMATIGLTVGLAVHTTLAMLIVTIGLTVGLAVRTTLTMLMATIGPTAGLATLAVLDPIGMHDTDAQRDRRRAARRPSSAAPTSRTTRHAQRSPDYAGQVHRKPRKGDAPRRQDPRSTSQIASDIRRAAKIVIDTGLDAIAVGMAAMKMYILDVLFTRAGAPPRKAVKALDA